MTKLIKVFFMLPLTLAALVGCGSGGSGGNTPSPEVGSSSSISNPASSSVDSSSSVQSSSVQSSSAQSSSSVLSSSSIAGSSSSVPSNIIPSNALIKLNQVGYRPVAAKVAIVPDTGATSFSVRDTQDGTVVFEGALTAQGTWEPSNDSVRKADFSSFTTPGRYRLQVDGLVQSYEFEIAQDVYREIHNAGLKAYYFNRAGMALEEAYAGVWSRPLGHPDTSVLVHRSAATPERPAGTVLSSPKGWYDAGDYNKYIVNSGISTYTLMLAYQHFPRFYQSNTLNIPESTDNVPDIINEIMWNIEWMETMQDLDGGVYHKLTTQNFSGILMPAQANDRRYVVQKGTAATLNFAAVMAMASRILTDYEAQFPGKSAAYRQAAIAAWQWASANSNVAYNQRASSLSDIQTGEYGGSNFNDEFAWAAAELYLLTQEPSYFNAFKSRNLSPGTPWWGGVESLAFISLATEGQSLLPPAEFDEVNNALVGLANNLVSIKNASAFDVAMRSADFGWGSNSAVMNQALMMLQAYRITNDINYKNAAQGALDYALGRNATDFSFVTGFGDKTPMDIHHRQSKADNVSEPVPGFLVGGPHSGQQDNCSGYPSNLPALSYLDDWCSFSTNEVTINWNAPLVYVLAALQAD